jgi:hypothetical protein
MSNRSAGSMRERPSGSGRWQLRAYIDRDPFTGKQRSVTETFVGSERSAAKALASLVTRAQNGTVSATTVTVGQPDANDPALYGLDRRPEWRQR